MTHHTTNPNEPHDNRAPSEGPRNTDTSLTPSRNPNNASPGESTSPSPPRTVPTGTLVTDGGSPTFSSDDLEETPAGRRVAVESSGAPMPSAFGGREYDPLAPVCNYCGLPIDHDHQPCPALDNGVCRP